MPTKSCPPLPDKGVRTSKNTPQRIQQANTTLFHWEVKMKNQSTLLRPYDFLTIVQARDNEVILKTAPVIRDA